MLPGILGKFSPSKIPNGAFWWEMDRGVTVVSGDVEQWNDQTGNARHLYKVNDARRPAYSATGVNGRPCAELVQANLDLLVSGAISGMANISKYSVTVVWKADINDTGTHAVLSQPTTYQAGIIFDNHLLQFRTNAHPSTGGMYLPAFTSTDWNILTWIFDGTQVADADRVRLWLNGVQQTLTHFGDAMSSTMTITALYLGSYLSSGMLTGKIAAVHGIAGVYSTTHRSQLTTHWGRKYGIAVTP